MSLLDGKAVTGANVELMVKVLIRKIRTLSTLDE